MALLPNHSVVFGITFYQYCVHCLYQCFFLLPYSACLFCCVEMQGNMDTFRQHCKMSDISPGETCEGADSAQCIVDGDPVVCSMGSRELLSWPGAGLCFRVGWSTLQVTLHVLTRSLLTWVGVLTPRSHRHLQLDALRWKLTPTQCPVSHLSISYLLVGTTKMSCVYTSTCSICTVLALTVTEPILPDIHTISS